MLQEHQAEQQQTQRELQGRHLKKNKWGVSGGLLLLEVVVQKGTTRKATKYRGGELRGCHLEVGGEGEFGSQGNYVATCFRKETWLCFVCVFGCIAR